MAEIWYISGSAKQKFIDGSCVPCYSPRLVLKKAV